MTSPHPQSEMAAVVEFENQDWVRDILQMTSTSNKGKTYADPNVAFPFQDDFLVGTIHGANAGANKSTLYQAGGKLTNSKGAIKILDNKDDNSMSVLTMKTQDELVALLVGSSSATPLLVARLPPAPTSSLEAAQLPRSPRPM
jgi:hypothetical protein